MQSEESNALVKLAKAVIEHAPEGADAFWDIKFSDIEAALSAAEPVSSRNDEAGYVEFLNQDVPYIVRDIQGAVAILMDLETRNVIGYRVYDPDSVFARQPAPSVAVKQLQWDEDGDNLKARMGDREWMLNITSDGKTWAGSTRPFVFGRNLTWSAVPNCSMVSLEAAKAACQADCQSRYAALSAQVQDVAGWKLVPIDPSAGMIAAAKSTTSAALTRSHATEIYRAMLAAAPAKQEGGHD